jgi:hypothetical protein
MQRARRFAIPDPGKGNEFDEALAGFATANAEQNERDSIRHWCARSGKAVSKCTPRAKDGLATFKDGKKNPE